MHAHVILYRVFPSPIVTSSKDENIVEVPKGVTYGGQTKHVSSQFVKF